MHPERANLNTPTERERVEALIGKKMELRKRNEKDGKNKCSLSSSIVPSTWYNNVRAIGTKSTLFSARTVLMHERCSHACSRKEEELWPDRTAELSRRYALPPPLHAIKTDRVTLFSAGGKTT